MILKNINSFKFLNVNNYYKIFCILVICIFGCVENYTPPTISSTGLLVVNGSAFIETKTCAIQLTRTQDINSKLNPTPELDAIVSLEDNVGNIYNLENKKNGNYIATNLTLNYNTKYRLKIKTADQKVYVSAYSSTLKSPAIQNINFEPSEEKDAIENVAFWNINIDANDTETKNKYYKINYIETWEYRSPLKSTLVFSDRNGFITINFRRNQDELFKCWKSDSNKAVLIYSTLNLNSSNISKFKINKVEVGTKKLNNAYSILVNLNTISQDEYKYWEDLKKNSELTGSIFDPQPSQVFGNVTNIADKKDNILGYFSVHSLSQKRITKLNSDLPNTEVVSTKTSDCFLTPIGLNEAGQATKEGYLLLSYRYDPLTGQIIGYFRGQQDCADCRLVAPKGTNNKPTFMP